MSLPYDTRKNERDLLRLRRDLSIEIQSQLATLNALGVTTLTVLNGQVSVGTARAHLVGFFGATPVACQTAAGVSAGFAQGSGLAVNDVSTFTGGIGATAYTLGDVVAILKTYGLLVP